MDTKKEKSESGLEKKKAYQQKIHLKCYCQKENARLADTADYTKII